MPNVPHVWPGRRHVYLLGICVEKNYVKECISEGERDMCKNRKRVERY